MSKSLWEIVNEKNVLPRIIRNFRLGVLIYGPSSSPIFQGAPIGLPHEGGSQPLKGEATF